MNANELARIAKERAAAKDGATEIGRCMKLLLDKWERVLPPSVRFVFHDPPQPIGTWSDPKACSLAEFLAKVAEP